MCVAVLLAAAAGCSPPGPTKDMKAAAGELRPPATWQLVEDTVTTDTLCQGKNCKMISKRWTTAELPTGTLLKGLAEGAGWRDIRFKDGVESCRPDPGTSGAFATFCELTASRDGANILLRAGGPGSSPTPWNVTFQVTRQAS